MRLFAYSTRCDEYATSIAGSCNNSVTGRVKSRACLVITDAEIKSKEFNNM